MYSLLLSNDDGVHAPGLKALREALLPCVDELHVVAPDRDRSGASNSLTLSSPLRATKVSEGISSVQGTPTDCVHLALSGYLKERPEMVISGINNGANLGDDVWYSGTVAAAMEGRFLGLPALAVSLVVDYSTPHEVRHFETAAAVAKTILLNLMEESLPSGTILNINVPNLPLEDVLGYEVTRLGTRHPSQPVIQRDDPRGGVIYWIGLVGDEQDSSLGTDFDAVRRQMVSITPLRIDLTNYESFDQVSQWVKRLP